MTEAEWQKRITDLCDVLGLRWHHETDSRRTREGFPDLVIVGNRVVFVELKTDSPKSKVTEAQRDWLLDIRGCGGEAYVWRPRQWDEVRQYLTDLARR